MGKTATKPTKTTPEIKAAKLAFIKANQTLTKINNQMGALKRSQTQTRLQLTEAKDRLIALGAKPPKKARAKTTNGTGHSDESE